MSKKMVFYACQECPNFIIEKNNVYFCSRSNEIIENPSIIANHCPLEDDE